MTFEQGKMHPDSRRNNIEKHHCSTETLLLKICEINDVIDRDVTEIRVGDEIVLHDIKIENVRITVEKNFANPDKASRESISIPSSSRGKYRPCPHYDPCHTFRSVQDILDIFPFVHDLIFPRESFTVEGENIPAWDPLQVVDRIVSPSNQSLRVMIVRRQTEIILPSTLSNIFVQWNKNWSFEGDSKILDNIKPRLYSLSDLCEFWSKKLHPMMVQIHDESNCLQPNCDHQAVKSPRAISKFFKKKKSSKSIIINSTTSSLSNEFYMIPEAWRCKKLVVEPIHVAHVSNPGTGKKFVLQENLKLKVKLQKIDTPSLPDNKFNPNGEFHLASPQRPRRSSDLSLPIHQLDLMSLFGSKERSDAIVAKVTSSLTTGSRQPGSLALGTKIALHRTRRVRKMLFKSQDSQYYLVSAYYGGEFKRLPLIYDLAGDVPINGETPYITRCTAYPVQKQLDSCHEGQYVWFQQQSEIFINDLPTPTKVVQCQVADSLDGEQRPVNYPLNLRGRFELVDETSTDISTRDLFRKELPVCVQVVKYDASIGFDPLKMKQHFQVVRIVSELTVIVEILKKGKEETNKAGSGTLFELPVKRCSLFVRELPTKSEDPVHGIEPYPIRRDFKGLEKLPCVEMLAERDVSELQNALRSTSSASALMQTFDGLNSPVHSINSSTEEGKVIIPTNNQTFEKKQLGPRKSKSVEDIPEASRESTTREKPALPKKQRRPATSLELENDPHLKRLESPVMHRCADDDASMQDDSQTVTQVEANGKPKPKPKPRRKTLPGFVVVNTDECISKKEVSLTNGVSTDESSDEKLSVTTIPTSLPVREVDKTKWKKKTCLKTDSQERDGSDYDEIEQSSENTDDYEDVAEEFSDAAPAIPPRTQKDNAERLNDFYPALPPRPVDLE